MERSRKEEFVADMKSRLEKAEATFLVDYQGLNVEAMSRLRRELREVGAELQVIKNRLLKLASEETDTASLQPHMEGPSALTVTYEDVVAPAKVLVNFAKDFEHLKIKAAQISGKVLDADAIKRLAELPSRDVLLAQALSAMQAVPGSFVRVLNGVLVKLLNVLKAIEQKKAEQ